jgi:hypothetical protein
VPRFQRALMKTRLPWRAVPGLMACTFASFRWGIASGRLRKHTIRVSKPEYYLLAIGGVSSQKSESLAKNDERDTEIKP